MADWTFLQSYVVSGASAYRSFRLIESAYDPLTEQRTGPESGSWALSMRPFSLSPPEMDEAAIGVVRMGRLTAVALTLIVLAL